MARFAVIRRLARAVRHAPDRLMHPLRRRAALRRLIERGIPRSVLFVCYGNICRSPYAAAAFAAALPAELRGHVAIGSAGFFGLERPSPEAAVRVAARRGFDLSSHRSARVTQENAGTADLVVVMDTTQYRAIRRHFGREAESVLILGDLDPLSIDTRTIRDPIDQPEEVFEASYARIDRCIRALVGALAEADRDAPTA
ncbi:MAG TPA: hypothetical protein VF188_11340 [Longimicrobiales bacterium]